MSRTEYSRTERVFDAIVHVVGVTFGVAANATLAVLIILRAELIHAAGLAIYGFGLLAMLVCSALYNITSEGWWKGMFRRLDHAAIFLLIAATYTPFALLVVGGRLGTGLLIFVWMVAIIGIVFKLISPTRWQGMAVATYLLLGWTILIALEPLLATISLPGLSLLIIGGVLYSVGVIFHLWTRLPYHRAIWHLFVLAAASCHFTAVLIDIAIVKTS